MITTHGHTRAAALVALLALAFTLSHARMASANGSAEASIMDDQLLLGASQAKVDRNMQIFKDLGVDRLRVSAFWNQLAPSPSSQTRPSGFTGANQADRRYGWTPLDRVVASARSHGLKVMISITTPAPLWATGSPRKRNPLWKPNATLFGNFAQAVATRYRNLVDQYGISNEPNQGGWLQPQSDKSGLVAPHLYRAMVLAAYPKIKAADPSSLALIGNLASSGRGGKGRRTPIRPLAFLRSFGCVDRRFHRVRSGRCRGFKGIPGDAIGHHPYEFFTPPSRPSANRDDAGIGDTRRLLRTVDRLVRAGRIKPSKGHRRLSVYYTEFGYQTDPPDPFAGISLSRQSRWLQDAAFVAWKAPRVKGLNQFRLTDGPLRGRGIARYREFQSGLLFSNRKKKPAYGTFPNPISVSGGTHPRRGRRVRLWGDARPGGRHTVQIQFRRSKRAKYRTVKRIRTSARGYFTYKLRPAHGYYRFHYTDGPRGSSQGLLFQPR